MYFVSLGTVKIFSGKTGLQLWFDEVKGDLAEEFPEKSEEDLFTEGMQRFRQLPKEERQVTLISVEAAPVCNITHL